MRKILILAFILTSSITVAFSQCTTNAGPDITICGDEEVGLGGIIPSGATSATWAGGVGTFDPNRNDPLAVYTPDASEVGSPVTLILNTNAPCGNGSDTMTIFVNNTPDLYNLDGFVMNVCPSTTVDLSSVNIVDSNNAGGTYSYEDSGFNVLASSVVSTGGIYYVRRTTNSQPPCEDFVSVAVIIQTCTGGCSNPPSLSDNSTDVTCNGDGDGAIDITLSGGVAPVSYTWSNGASTEDLGNLSGGVYTVTVSDNEGCTDELTVTVNEPAALNATITTNDPTQFCQNPAQGALLESTPDASVTKQWIKGTSDILGATGDTHFGDKQAGYKLRVTGPTGCVLVGNKITLSKFPSPPATITTPSNTFCGGESALLTANSGPYTYEWLRYGNVIAGATTNQYSATKTGNYKVSVIDSNGCYTRSAKTVLQKFVRPKAAVSPTTAQLPSPICDGDTILLTATATRGAAPYTYQWYRYNNMLSGQTGTTYTSTNFGGYKVEVTDANGCKDNSPRTVITETCRIGNDTYELTSSLHLAAYPSPFANSLTLALNNFTDENVRIIIRDAVGKVVYDKNDAAKFNYSINTSNYNTGMYIVELHQGDALQRVKIMKNE